VKGSNIIACRRHEKKTNKNTIRRKTNGKQIEIQESVDSWAKIDSSVITTQDIFHERSF